MMFVSVLFIHIVRHSAHLSSFIAISIVSIIAIFIVVNLVLMMSVVFCLHRLVLVLGGIVEGLLDGVLLLLGRLEEHHCDLLGSFGRDLLL